MLGVSKSRTTWYQYKELLKDQKRLEDFGWKKAVESELHSSDDDSDNIEIPVQIHQEPPPSLQVHRLWLKMFKYIKRPQPCPQLLFDDQIIQLGKQKATHNDSENPDQENNLEDPITTDDQWEDELDECLASNLTDIRGWDLLHKKIKDDLEKIINLCHYHRLTSVWSSAILPPFI